MVEDNTGNGTSTVLVSSARPEDCLVPGTVTFESVGDMDQLTLSYLEPVSVAEVSTDKLDDYFATQ